MSLIDEFFIANNIKIGPSDEQRLRDQEKALNRESDRITAAVEQGRRKIAAFNEKYGEDLGDYARAYASRTKPGSHVFVHLTGHMIEVSQVRSRYAMALVEALSAQPEDSRVEWLTEFLVKLDRF